MAFTTLVCIVQLDAALFESAKCALIAHTLNDDKRLFREKVIITIVSDGYGGKEPKFTLMQYLTSQEKAKAILDKIASSLRGSSVWDGSYSRKVV